jgi:Fungal protein kinase
MSGNKPKAALDTSRVEFFIEMKSVADPFDDHPSESRPFVRESGNSQTSLGQITIYATAILGVQYRTHVFSVIMVENYARLIRWDRSGTVVTEPIYYNKSPHLLDFLIHYGTADPQVRGHDSTVDQPTEDEIGDARTIVPELKDVESFLAITMPDQDQQRRFIISSPECRPHILVGQWTRASIALDTKLRRHVLLKDSWRVLLETSNQKGCSMIGSVTKGSATSLLAYWPVMLALTLITDLKLT